MIDWLLKQLESSLPEALGALVAAGVLAALSAYVRLRSRGRGRVPNGTLTDLARELLEPDLIGKFEFENLFASTSDDEAGLALISSIIDRKATSRIQVIGRGSQWVDRRTRHYISAVARAILKGVEYNRILILDAVLPQNGLVWLLLLERFAALPEHRGRVVLYPVRMQQSQSLTLQFQLVDEKYLHRTNRHYHPKEPGVSRRAHSLFAVAPHREVREHAEIFRQHVERQAAALSHPEIADLIAELLTTVDPARYTVAFHWRLVLDVLHFLDNLEVGGLPARGVRLLGSLMPFTFTFEAASRFAQERRESQVGAPIVVVPFERLEDAVTSFRNGDLDLICVPVENSRIDQLTPPSVRPEAIAELKAGFPAVKTFDVQVSFALAGKPAKPSKSARLASVDAAYQQVKDSLPKKIRELPVISEETQSNYHAAWIASRDSDVVAVTTASAAAFFQLQVYNSLSRNGGSVTTFSVFSRSGEVGVLDFQSVGGETGQTPTAGTSDDALLEAG